MTALEIKTGILNRNINEIENRSLVFIREIDADPSDTLLIKILEDNNIYNKNNQDDEFMKNLKDEVKKHVPSSNMFQIDVSIFMIMLQL